MCNIVLIVLWHISCFKTGSLVSLSIVQMSTLDDGMPAKLLHRVSFFVGVSNCRTTHIPYSGNLGRSCSFGFLLKRASFVTNHTHASLLPSSDPTIRLGIAWYGRHVRIGLQELLGGSTMRRLAKCFSIDRFVTQQQDLITFD